MALHALNYLFGGGSTTAEPSPTSAGDPDFVDFASPPPAPTQSTYGSSFLQVGGTPYGRTDRPYTKWYRIWERTSIHDFYQELMIIPILLVVVVVNMIGGRMNRAKLKAWAASYLPLIEQEYASVGFASDGPSSSEVQSKGLAQAIEESNDVPAELLRQKKKYEFFTYATGRQNVAWLDVKLTLYKRYNPFVWFLEAAASFFFDSVPPPEERMEATAYAFDGREKALLPDAAGSIANSTYDGFVWAVVHKDKMKQLRDDRYDLSLTATRDHAKLPDFATVMSESAEITEMLMTPELVKAIEQAGEDLEALVISDMPIDAPRKLNDLQPRKRISLSLRLPSSATSSTTKALFQYFLRLPDILVQQAHFRPEAIKKIKQTRDEEVRKIKKIDEGEKAEERKSATDKAKKEERERKLKGMSAEEQRKFLEREAAADRKKGMRRAAVRG